MTYIIILILLSFSALFSGLTLGFFSLNKDDLKRKANLGDIDAQKVYSLRENGNLLLCTLLIGNVAVNSALSIFLGSIISGILAGLTATGLIVVFGEIAPQAVFSRHALVLGARLAWLVRLLLIILLPVCWPLAWVLNRALGVEMPVVYSKRELMKIVEDHENMKESEIDEDEEKIIKGALSFSEKTVKIIMTPRVEVYALSADQTLDLNTIRKIYEAGHSRIPVYENDIDHIIGILYSKDLIANDLKDKIARDVCRKDVIFVESTKRLDELMNAFKKTRHHLFVVLNEFGGVSGIVTIEDVLEEIIGEEIVDEFDHHEDLQKEARKKMEKIQLYKT